MAIYKDENIYRTYEEQVDHLTEAHRKQLTVNSNLSEQLNELIENTSYGGQNLVRFSFLKRGNLYYSLSDSFNSQTQLLGGDVGDYVEISSGRPDDIPAYGYISEGGATTCKITLAFKGDFIDREAPITMRNVKKGKTNTPAPISTSLWTSFGGTSLNDYDPNDRKKQVFNVLDDVFYNSRTQYGSFDLNGDGVYNFVYLGAVFNGEDGKSVRTTTGSDTAAVVAEMQEGDSILFGADNKTSAVDASATAGDLYRFAGNNRFVKMGNIKGAKGAKGDKGDTGNQGIQGVQGPQGAKGAKGDKGDKGDTGDQGLTIYTGVKNSPDELPPFSSAKLGDAYRVINTSGTTVAYDLYFKAEGGTTWDIQPNWGGVKGDKGDKGDTGNQGIQGVQGPQGAKGAKGDKGDKGDTGDQGLTIYTGVKNSPDELPPFSSAKLGDAYRVINTSGTTVAYDLYFKAEGGTTWDIQPNWGGVKGDKGDKGDTGNQGIQGVQGPQGAKGAKGDKGDKGDTGVDGKSYGCPVYCFLNAPSVTYTRESDGEEFSGYISCKFTIYTSRPENETNITLDNFKDYILYLNDIASTYHHTSGFIPCSGAFTCTDGKDLAIIITGMNFQDFDNGNFPITFDGVINDMTETANIGASDKTRMVDFNVEMSEMVYFVGVPVPQPPI